MRNRLKVFNLEEANAMLPEIESLLALLEAKQDAFRRLHDELLFLELLEQASPPEERLQELEEILEGLEQEIEKIRKRGCLLRHPERGLVDFLAQRGEGWVYYCWRRGEKQIQFYHSLRGGFLERQPLSG